MFAAEQPRRDAMSLHHDLLIELGRIEMAMEHLSTDPDHGRDDPQRRERLQARLGALRQALERLPA